MNRQAEKEFLHGLKELTLKTGISIEGCGCCGSPYLVELNKESLTQDSRYGYGYANEVIWISSTQQWHLEKSKGQYLSLEHN